MTMAADILQLGLLEEEDIELDSAALALSALDHPGVDLAPYLALLQSIGTRLATVGHSLSDANAQAQALAQVFSLEFGFAGDKVSYDAPLNADMIRVLDRRKGLPVSLSILYVAAARRLGWNAHPLNTPGHVLASVGPDSGRVMIDPFNRGEMVGAVQAAALFGSSWQISVETGQSPLEPMSNRQVLARLLINQASRAEQEGDLPRATILYERMTQVAPSIGQGWWDLARLQLVKGDVEASRRSLSAMLEITRDPDRRTTVTTALEALAGR